MAVLARIWRWLKQLFVPSVAKRTTIPTAQIKCPCCGADYTLALKAIPINASQATLVCANPHCKEQMELYPDASWGWLCPHVTLRPRAT